MINLTNVQTGFHIPLIKTCHFESLNSLSNVDVLEKAGQKDSTKISRFIEKKMGIERRFHCDEDVDALDLAKQALGDLVQADPSILEDADFLIYSGISNPMPIATHSALLGNEFGFKQPSCWDIKSGCSSGLLALIQANAWLNMGAKRGVIVASETLSKFSNPDVLQMSAAVGDGAVAFIVEQSDQWHLKSIVHGTDPQYVTSMLVDAKIPVPNDQYEREDFRFTFNDKGNSIEVLGNYWIKSLQELLQSAGIDGQQVQHYVAHQVDGSKNALIASSCGIEDGAVAKNFKNYGNMGSPTIFINYKQWMENNVFKPGEHLVLHAVGGGLSWAGMCLEYKG